MFDIARPHVCHNIPEHDPISLDIPQFRLHTLSPLLSPLTLPRRIESITRFPFCQLYLEVDDNFQLASCRQLFTEQTQLTNHLYGFTWGMCKPRVTPS